MPPTIVLLQPPGACTGFTRSGSIYPPLGLCQIAASCPEDRVMVLDAEGHGWSDEETINQLASLDPACVGLSASTYGLTLVETWARAVKSLGASVIAGGPHATLEPTDLLCKCPSVDTVVRGEAELVFGQILARVSDSLPLDGLPGVVTRNGSASSKILRVTDFSGLPFPRYEGLPLEQYTCPDAVRGPMITFMSTRGCPNSCTFCASPVLVGRQLRGWPVENVLGQLKYLTRNLGVREISFVDDGFTANRGRALALCQGMVELELDLSWFCNARADRVTPALAHVMANAGCHQVYLGLESGSQQMLDTVGKRTSIESMVRGAEILRTAGINLSAGFVIGLPGETDETVEATINLAREINPRRLQFTRYTWLPGSAMGEAKPVQEGGFHNCTDDDQVGEWITRAYKNSGFGSTTWAHK